jgi:hypothetical protein
MSAANRASCPALGRPLQPDKTNAIVAATTKLLLMVADTTDVFGVDGMTGLILRVPPD